MQEERLLIDIDFGNLEYAAKVSLLRFEIRIAGPNAHAAPRRQPE